MRIIEENKSARCENCKVLVGFEEKEIEVGEFGCKYILCPNCGEKIWLDVETGIKITADNIEYPRHFHFPKDAKVISDEEIQEAVKRVANNINNIEEGNFYVGLYTGDTMVLGLNWEDEFEIYVCKNPIGTVIFKDDIKGDF